MIKSGTTLDKKWDLYSSLIDGKVSFDERLACGMRVDAVRKDG